MTPTDKILKIKELYEQLRFAYDFNGETEWDDLEETLNELLEETQELEEDRDIQRTMAFNLNELRREANTSKYNIEEKIKEMITAWESLPEGEYDSETTSDWLMDDMKPVIDDFRNIIK